MTARVDRAAAVRAALRRLVARNGFHGASMSAVAAEAGVAAGTAYVHYASKDDLVLATYLEVKRDLGAAAVAGLDPSAPADARFLHLWHGVHRHLAADPDRARLLESSRIIHESLSGGARLSLDSKSSEAVDGLWCEPQMTHDRYPCLDDFPYRSGH
jgi:AcrR family transcriptional regulator